MPFPSDHPFDFDRWEEDKAFHERRHSNASNAEKLDPAFYLPISECTQRPKKSQNVEVDYTDKSMKTRKTSRSFKGLRAWLRKML